MLNVCSETNSVLHNATIAISANCKTLLLLGERKGERIQIGSDAAHYELYNSGLISNAFILRNNVLLSIPSCLAAAVLLPLFRLRA